MTEKDKENMMFAVFSKETHLLMVRKDLQFLIKWIEQNTYKPTTNFYPRNEEDEVNYCRIKELIEK